MNNKETGNYFITFGNQPCAAKIIISQLIFLFFYCFSFFSQIVAKLYHEDLPNIGRIAKNRTKQCCQPSTLKKFLPILDWLPKYNFSFLIADLVAGLTVGLTAIPQAIAYGSVAGLPTQYGLYSAFMGCFVYIVLGTCKDITVGKMEQICFQKYEN